MKNNYSRQSRWNASRIVIVLLQTLVIFVAAGNSQLPTQHNEGNKDNALRGGGRVNSSTLGMEIDIPLANYSGRGITMPISLSYSSKVWRIDPQTIEPRINGTCFTINAPRYSEKAASGWTTSLAAPYIEYVGWSNLFSVEGFPLMASLCPEPDGPVMIRRILVHLPSGETHELRTDDSRESYSYSSPPSKNGTYYATDGSNLKYVEISGTNTYRLQMPDGSYYDFETSTNGFAVDRRAVKFTDRNGNNNSYNTSTGVWTDTLGRNLSAPFGTTAPTSPATTIYQLPGMTESYSFHWKKLKGPTSTGADSGLTNPSDSLKYRGDMYLSGNNYAYRSAGAALFYSNPSGSYDLRVEGGHELFNPIVLTEIELPTGQSYRFTYDIYGRIERIHYPTGGEEHFTYNKIAPLTPSDQKNVSDQANFGVTQRKLYYDSAATPYIWNYSASYVAPRGYKVSVESPDDVITDRILYRGPDPPSSPQNGTFGYNGYDEGLTGMPYEERTFDSLGRLFSRNLTHWTTTKFDVYTFNSGEEVRAHWHPRATHTENFVYDPISGNGVKGVTKLEYVNETSLARESPLLTKRVLQYAFETVSDGTGITPAATPNPNPTPVPTPVPATLVKEAETTYLIHDSNYAAVSSNYINQNMVGLVTESVIKDGSGTVVSKSITVFDESGKSPGYRGNPTSLKVWDSTKGAYTSSGAYISTSAKFDSYGNQYESTDARGCTTETEFDSTYNSFPIEVTSCTPSDGTYGANSAFVTTATFDPTTGLPLTTTNANGLITAIEYEPDTLRPLNTKNYHTSVSGGNQVGSTVETIYHDEPGNYWVKNRSQIDTGIWAETITYFDGLGRAWKTEEVNSKGNIFVEKEFDAEGRVKRVSNPYRAGETKIWTTNTYDEASRLIEVELQDGSTITTDHGVSTSAPIGITKQITDQAGKKRKGITDVQGRMVRVIEDPSGTPLNTDYVFDTLGNLRKTIQGDQNRFFMHDSLGRLLYAKQPEQETRGAFSATDPITANTAWSVKYEYDDNGNITRTTDARGVTIDGNYDAFNRLKTRDYSGSTPDVTFYYDGYGLGGVPNYSKGKTTKVTSSVSETRYTSFDILGRLLTHEQRTPFGGTETVGTATPRVTGYQYNLSGGLIKETYPSGREISHDIDANGDLERVWGNKSGSISTYANAFNYNPSGAIEKMRLGNGRWETAVYNERLQVEEIGLGTGSESADLLKLEFDYGNNTQNNGSLREQKITVPTTGSTSGFTATQTYTYDDLNRLRIAEEKIASSTTWKQTFDIDRYGNREYDAVNTTTLGSCPQAVCNPDISTLNNRFTSSGWDYDEAGNVIEDAEGKQFTYDAENHQVEVKDNVETVLGQYFYDGEGKRIKKIAGAETTVFVYNASGQLVAEYSTQTSSTPQVSYLTTDHLGSTRLVTDQLGAVKDRKDFGAFGDETMTAARVSGLGYNVADPTRKGYTGYEKDGESGLEFAQARYYNTTHGRYTSVDPMTASMSVKNPQTFNRYTYVVNSPYKYSDPLGLLEDCRTCSIFDMETQSSEQARAEQEKRRQKKEQERHKRRQAAKKAKSPSKPSNATPPPPPSGPIRSYVPPQSNDPTVAADNNSLSEVFTDGGVVRSNRLADEIIIEGGQTHFRLSNGQVVAIHIHADETGTESGNLYVPDGFKLTWHGGTSDTVTGFNRATGDYIVIFHVKGVRSQAQLDKNVQTTNKAGSILVGQTGGKGGNIIGNLHSCLKIFKGREGYKTYVEQYDVGSGAVDSGAWSDLRRYIKQ